MIEFWPGTTIRKSLDNCFTKSFDGKPINWAPMQVNADRAAKLSGNEHKPFQVKPKAEPKPKAPSKASQIRDLIRLLPMSGSEIAAAIGIDPAGIHAYMHHDISAGKIVTLRKFKPVRFALKGWQE